MQNGCERALASFAGVKRRFEFYVNTPKQVYMDDYAHHPRELAATLTSVRKMFPGRRITALFQPHLYTRTRDLHAEFAEALSHADEVVLLPIYPAREEPIPGHHLGDHRPTGRRAVPYRRPRPFGRRGGRDGHRRCDQLRRRQYRRLLPRIGGAIKNEKLNIKNTGICFWHFRFRLELMRSLLLDKNDFLRGLESA